MEDPDIIIDAAISSFLDDKTEFAVIYVKI